MAPTAVDRKSMKVPGSNKGKRTLRDAEIGTGASQPDGGDNESLAVGAMLTSAELLDTFVDPGDYIDDLRNVSIGYLSRTTIQILDEELHLLSIAYFNEQDDIGALTRIYTPMPLSWSVDTITATRKTIIMPETRPVGSHQYGNTMTESKTGVTVDTARNIKSFVCDADLDNIDGWIQKKNEYLRLLYESFALDFKAMIYHELLHTRFTVNVSRQAPVSFQKHVERFFIDLGFFNKAINKSPELLVTNAQEEMAPNNEGNKMPVHMIVTDRVAARCNLFSPAILYVENGPGAANYVQGGRKTLVMESGLTVTMCNVRDKIRGKDWIVTQEMWLGDCAISMEDPNQREIAFYSYKSDSMQRMPVRTILEAFARIHFSGPDGPGGPEDIKYWTPTRITPVGPNMPVGRTDPGRLAPGPFLNTALCAWPTLGSMLDENPVTKEIMGGIFDSWVQRGGAAPEFVNADDLLNSLRGDVPVGGGANNNRSYPLLANSTPAGVVLTDADYVAIMGDANLAPVAANLHTPPPPGATPAQIVTAADAARAVATEQLRVIREAWAVLGDAGATERPKIEAYVRALPMNVGNLLMLLSMGLPLPFASGVFSFNLLRGDTTIIAADNVGYAFISEIKSSEYDNAEGIQKLHRAQHKTGIITLWPEAVYRATLSLVTDAVYAGGNKFVNRDTDLHNWKAANNADNYPPTLVPVIVGYDETPPPNKLNPMFHYFSGGSTQEFTENSEPINNAGLMFLNVFGDKVNAIKANLLEKSNIEWIGHEGHNNCPFLSERVTLDVYSFGSDDPKTRVFDSTFPSTLRNGSRKKRFVKIPMTTNHATDITLRG